MIVYRGFGTIENPHTWIATLSFMHNPILDGEEFNPDSIINPKPLFNLDNCRIEIFDFSK